jgi:hypothetical protein
MKVRTLARTSGNATLAVVAEGEAVVGIREVEVEDVEA